MLGSPPLFSPGGSPLSQRRRPRPSSHPFLRSPLVTRHSPLSLLLPTLACHRVSAHSKGLTNSVTPLDSTLTKKPGGGASLQDGPISLSAASWFDPTPLIPFASKSFRTLCFTTPGYGATALARFARSQPPTKPCIPSFFSRLRTLPVTTEGVPPITPPSPLAKHSATRVLHLLYVLYFLNLLSYPNVPLRRAHRSAIIFFTGKSLGTALPAPVSKGYRVRLRSATVPGSGLR